MLLRNQGREQHLNKQPNPKLNMTTTSVFECPICMDAIEVGKNCLTTECGHTFHSTCMLKNVSVNGFNCPCCRHEMVEEPKEEEEDDDDVELWGDDDEFDVIDTTLDNDDLMRGFRLFWNTVEERQHNSFDIEDDIPSLPSHFVIAEALKKHKVSYETLVQVLLCEQNDSLLEFNGYHDKNSVRHTFRMRKLISTMIDGHVPPDFQSEEKNEDVDDVDDVDTEYEDIEEEVDQVAIVM